MDVEKMKQFVNAPDDKLSVEGELYHPVHNKPGVVFRAAGNIRTCGKYRLIWVSECGITETLTANWKKAYAADKWAIHADGKKDAIIQLRVRSLWKAAVASMAAAGEKSITEFIVLSVDQYANRKNEQDLPIETQERELIEKLACVVDPDRFRALADAAGYEEQYIELIIQDSYPGEKEKILAKFRKDARGTK